jgi:hypothetical protein
MTEPRVIRVLRALLATTVIALLSSPQGSAQPATFQRGEYVRMREAPLNGLPSEANHLSGILLKVIAVPGDHIRVERVPPPRGAWPVLSEFAIYVNDVAVSGFPQFFMARVNFGPERITVPEGQYFVMGAGYQRNGLVAPIHGMFPAMNLETAP